MSKLWDRRPRAARKLRPAAVALVAAVAAATAVTAASAAGALPLAPVDLGATHAYNGLQARPKRIIYTGDGTGFLGGRYADRASSSLHWTRWTSHVAKGSGYDQLNDCKPYCAAGKFHAYKVRIELWRPRTLKNTLLFTRLTIWYQGRRPSGQPWHYTFTDSRMASGFGFSPPSEDGYCVHTFGQKPEASCKNIHSLP